MTKHLSFIHLVLFISSLTAAAEFIVISKLGIPAGFWVQVSLMTALVLTHAAKVAAEKRGSTRRNK